MTNFERISRDLQEFENVVKLIDRYGLDLDYDYCPLDSVCPFGEEDVNPENCRDCIRKWLRAEV